MISKLKKFYILYISFFLITVKWFFSFYFFQEDIDVKIIFESVTDGKYYYPLIKYLSDLNLTASFDPNIDTLKIIPIPVSSLLLHSIFLKLFNFYSFIFLEFICLSTFILLIYKINRFIFSKKVSLLYSLLILISPTLINFSYLSEIEFLKIFGDNLYNFRVPRPMISNLFLLGFIYLILKMYTKNIYTVKKFLFIGIIMGLSLSSFYYYFFLQSITLLSILIIKYKFNIFKKILIDFKNYVVLIFSFLITSSPFLLNLLFHESDFTNRQCVYDLNLEFKQTLFKFYINQFTEISFILVLLTVVFSSIWLSFKNNKNSKFISLFCILFISSILSPLFFIIISNKACVFYHFNNLIVVTGILYLIFILFIYLDKFLVLLKIIKFNKIINLIFLFFICITFYLSSLSSFKNDGLRELRKEFNNITKIIKNNDEINNLSILTFETDFMIWAIMNEVKYLHLINGLFTSKEDHMIEKDIFSAFKILGLNDDNLNKFLNNKNDKSNWRYLNLNISTFFFYKYQANSMITFKNMQEFTEDELKYIKKSSPILHQQSIIPQLELKRLQKEFKNFRNSDPKPNFLILSKRNNFYEIDELNLIDYCVGYKGKNYVLYKQISKYGCTETSQ